MFVSSQQPVQMDFLFVWIVFCGPQEADVSHPLNGGSVRETASVDDWILLYHVGEMSHRDLIMSNGRDPQSGLFQCNIKGDGAGRWGGCREMEKNAKKREEGKGWSERREGKFDLLLLDLFICWGQQREPTRSLEAGIATVREIPVSKPTGLD